MAEVMQDQEQIQALAATAERLKSLLQQVRKDEEKLKRILDLRRPKRQLKAAKSNESSTTLTAYLEKS